MKRRILHVTQATGGVETILLLQLRHARHDVFEFHLACPPDTSLGQKARELGIRVFDVPMVRSASPRKDLAALASLVRTIRRERYAVVHAHSAKGGFLGRLAGRIAGGAKLLYHPHAFSYLSQRRPARDIFLQMERSARWMTDVVIASSESERTRAIRQVGFPADRVVVIPNSVDLAEEPAPPPPSPVPVVMTVGRLSYQKNPLMFVEAARLVSARRPDVRFVMLGAGFASELEREVRDAVRTRGLEERLAIVPWVPRAGSLEAMAGCSVFVLTSLFEGMPNAVLEAMMVRRPVVVTDVDGSRDCVEHGTTGFVVPSNDHGALADRILALLADPAAARAMGEAGRARIEQRHTVEHVASLWHRVYVDALS